jgi:murein DD-endopeptidase MepM/ murein hydrolase activator NlpD
VVSTLQKQQKTIQSLIEQQQKKDAELNAQIDRLIAEEIARAKARAEAERKRKEAEAAAKKRAEELARKKAAEEAARKKAAEELARKKAAAEAAAKENARRIAEAKAREEKAKAEARAAARKSAEEKRRAEAAARAAEKVRREEERKAAAAEKARKRELAEAREREKRAEREAAEARRKAREEETSYSYSSEDRRLSGNFESNRGRLPMPITGGYKIVNRFGQYAVEGLKGHVTLDNKGINIKGQAGAEARSVFDGKVTSVFNYAGSWVVIVSHGTYLSVYTNLASISVSSGQQVSARQTLGRIGGDGIMQFQLRRGSTPLNPMSWLSR